MTWPGLALRLFFALQKRAMNFSASPMKLQHI